MSPHKGKTEIILNVYDIMDSNKYTSIIGIGFYHSGIEIAGDEYSFAKGSGIFFSQPKKVDGVKFKESILLGIFDGNYIEAKHIIESLKSEFDGDTYHLIKKNCNSFTNALSYRMFQYGIPSYINRIANMANFFSCFIPKNLLESSSTSVASTSSFLKKQNRINTIKSFEGTGRTFKSSEKQDSEDKKHNENDIVNKRDIIRDATIRRLQKNTMESL